MVGWEGKIQIPSKPLGYYHVCFLFKLLALHWAYEGPGFPSVWIAAKIKMWPMLESLLTSWWGPCPWSSSQVSLILSGKSLYQLQTAAWGEEQDFTGIWESCEKEVRILDKERRISYEGKVGWCEIHMWLPVLHLPRKRPKKNKYS